MPKSPPLSDEERARIVELAAAGWSRNAIARELGRSGRTVSNFAATAGLSFDRDATAAATAAKVADSQARLAELAATLIDDAHRIRRQLWEPCRVFSFGGRDNVYNEHELDRPDFAGQVKILTGVGIAVDKAMKIQAAAEGGSGVRPALVDLLDRIIGGDEGDEAA